MGSELELYEARVSYLRMTEGVAEIHLSYVSIHKTTGTPGRDTGRGWSQEAVLVLEGAQVTEPMPPLPNVIVDGYLQVDDTRFELIPLPFERKGLALVHFVFNDGALLEVQGEHPLIRLEGEKVFLEGYL